MVLSERHPPSEFAGIPLASLDSSDRPSLIGVIWSSNVVSIYYGCDTSCPLLATIQNTDTVYIHSILSATDTKWCINDSLTNAGGPTGGMMSDGAELCQHEEDRLNDLLVIEELSHRRGASLEEKRRVDAAFRQYLFATELDVRDRPRASEAMINKLLGFTRDMPKPEIQKVAQSICASGLDLDDEELRQLLLRVSKVLRVSKARDVVTKRRLQMDKARAEAEEEERRAADILE